MRLPDKFFTTADVARALGCSTHRVQRLCKTGRIDGACLVAGVWIIPTNYRISRGKRGPKLRIDQ